MEINDIIARLKQTENEESEVNQIIKEYERFTIAKKVLFLNKLKKEMKKSENADIIHILKDLKERI